MVAYLEHFAQNEEKHFCFRKLWEMFPYLSAALDIFRMALTVQCMEAEGKDQYLSLYLRYILVQGSSANRTSQGYPQSNVGKCFIEAFCHKLFQY